MDKINFLIVNNITNEIVKCKLKPTVKPKIKKKQLDSDIKFLQKLKA